MSHDPASATERAQITLTLRRGVVDGGLHVYHYNGPCKLDQESVRAGTRKPEVLPIVKTIFRAHEVRFKRLH